MERGRETDRLRETDEGSEGEKWKIREAGSEQVREQGGEQGSLPSTEWHHRQEWPFQDELGEAPKPPHAPLPKKRKVKVTKPFSKTTSFYPEGQNTPVSSWSVTVGHCRNSSGLDGSWMCNHIMSLCKGHGCIQWVQPLLRWGEEVGPKQNFRNKNAEYHSCFLDWTVEFQISTLLTF